MLSMRKSSRVILMVTMVLTKEEDLYISNALEKLNLAS